jgi:hypothetical protein
MSGKSTTALNGTVSVGSSMNTTGIVDSGNISSTGNITSSGLITGSSFQNTANSGSISSAGVINGNTLQVTNAITVGGLAAITGGINVTGDIKTTTGSITATAGSITAGVSLVGAYQNTTLTPSASITSAGAITGTSLALGSGAIGSGAITSTSVTASGLITANGGLTMGGSNHITLTTATGTIPAINQLGYAIVKGPSTATVTNTSTALVFANVISGANGTGTYMVTYTVNTTGAWVGATSGYITFSYSQGGTPSVTMLGTPPLLSYSTGLNGVSWVVVVQVTANGPGIGLNAITNAAGISVGVTSSAVFTKIA